ncbi:MAG: ERF family protein [Lachnospiraceae bacterium]|nr:ERF family protein [Lachnospiraceae bacterium]
MNKNVFTKLLEARVEFLKNGTKKSGKNKAIMYSYFELEDIVPVATSIFAKLGLVSIVSFTETEATMTIVNCENPDDKVVFTSPMRYPAPNKGTNEVQTLGSTITYLRRYLYMVALNIIESDGFDAGLNEPKPEPKSEDKPIEIKEEPKTEKKITIKPKTEEERKEIKEALVDEDGFIDNAMRSVIIKKIGDLVKKKPESKDYAKQLNSATEGFTKIKKSEYSKWLEKLEEKLNG